MQNTECQAKKYPTLLPVISKHITVIFEVTMIKKREGARIASPLNFCLAQ